ncbi:putative fatty acid elongation protein [Dirofilaria immitis]
MDYDAQLSIEWMEQHRPLFMILIIAYALFVINMPRIWKGRGNRDLALIIFYWNAFNALMDIILLLSLLPEFLSSFHEGFYSSLCLSAGLYKNSKSAAQSCVWKRRTCSARVIGSIQIAQFPICLFGLFKIRQFLNAKKKCETNYNGPCIVIYSSFFILFVRFYVSKYIKDNNSKKVFKIDSKGMQKYRILHKTSCRCSMIATNTYME